MVGVMRQPGATRLRQGSTPARGSCRGAGGWRGDEAAGGHAKGRVPHLQGHREWGVTVTVTVTVTITVTNIIIIIITISLDNIFRVVGHVVKRGS